VLHPDQQQAEEGPAFSFCSSDMNTQSATSATVRPQPRQTSSKVVEQTATQGVSGRCWRWFIKEATIGE